MLEEATGPRSPTGQPRAEAGFEPRVPSLRWGAWEPLSVHRSCETPNPGGLQLQVLFFCKKPHFEEGLGISPAAATALGPVSAGQARFSGDLEPLYLRASVSPSASLLSSERRDMGTPPGGEDREVLAQGLGEVILSGTRAAPRNTLTHAATPRAPGWGPESSLPPRLPPPRNAPGWGGAEADLVPPPPRNAASDWPAN